MTDLRTSVVIPVFNRSGLLGRALKSLVPQMEAASEIIVVDDGSTEDIAAVLAPFAAPNLRLVRHAQNAGAAAARNTGVCEARGSYIAFLDSDDEWLPGKLQRQIEYLETHPAIALCCTAYEIRRLGRAPEVRRFEHDVQGAEQMAFGCALSPGSTLCARRDLFLAVGGFDQDMPRLEDWDWLLRATDHSKIGILNEPLAIIHNGAWPTEEIVDVSTKHIGRLHRERFRQLGRRHAMRFSAALLHERAVAAFRAGSAWRAGWLYFRSLLAYPFRRPRHFRVLLANLLKTREMDTSARGQPREKQSET